MNAELENLREHAKVMLAALPLFALLAGCELRRGAAPQSAPVQGAAPAAPKGSGAPAPLERQVLDLTNRARAQARTCGRERFGAAPPLKWNADLAQAARRYAGQMARQNFFAHQGPSGATPWDRIRAAGYGDFRLAGENLAGGTRTPQETVQGWLNSPGHCANLMEPGFRELGVGYAQNPDSTYRLYWVQEFGSRSLF